MVLAVAQEMHGFGLSTAALVARGIDNSKTSIELLAYRRAVGMRLASYWKNRSISAHPAIREYHRVHEAFGVSNEPPAPEKLILFVRRNRDFTAAGALVDCYNMVSARTLLSLGAHDLDQLRLPITLRRLTKDDVFQPLGADGTHHLEGEFGYVDTSGNVICRLDVLQCEWSKVTKNTRSVVFFLQGNCCLPSATLLKGTWLLAEMVSKFCGGQVELTSFLDAGGVGSSDLARPQIEIDAFKRMKLETGTVTKITPLDGLALTSATIRIHGEIDALAPRNVLDGALGQRVIVATGLHPLTVAGRRFTAYLPMLQSATGERLPVFSQAIPEGKRLY